MTTSCKRINHNPQVVNYTDISVYRCIHASKWNSNSHLLLVVGISSVPLSYLCYLIMEMDWTYGTDTEYICNITVALVKYHILSSYCLFYYHRVFRIFVRVFIYWLMHMKYPFQDKQFVSWPTVGFTCFSVNTIIRHLSTGYCCCYKYWYTNIANSVKY